jgi:hypothetical protein
MQNFILAAFAALYLIVAVAPGAFSASPVLSPPARSPGTRRPRGCTDRLIQKLTPTVSHAETSGAASPHASTRPVMEQRQPGPASDCRPSGVAEATASPWYRPAEIAEVVPIRTIPTMQQTASRRGLQFFAICHDTTRQPGFPGSRYCRSTGPTPQIAITAGSVPFATTPS